MSLTARCLQAVSTCQVCLDSYDEGRRRPKLLCCGHTFCLRCLTEIARLAVSAERRHRSPSSGAETKTGTLACPKCRVVTPLLPPHRAAARLADNLAIVDFLTADRSLQREPEPEQELRHCAKHPEKLDEYFCMSCCRLLCPACALEHASQTPAHTLRDVVTAATDFRRRLRSALDYSRERLALLERVLRDTEGKRRQMSALCLSLEHLAGNVSDVELLSQTNTLMGLRDPDVGKTA